MAKVLLRRKVRRLGDVPTMIEAAMVGVGIGEYNVPLFLHDLLVRDPILVQHFRRDHARLVPHEVGAPEKINYFS